RPATSAPMSKSSRCTRTANSASRDRRKQRNLARAGNGCGRMHVLLVDGGAHDAGPAERLGVLRAAALEPADPVGDRRKARRQVDDFLGLADLLAHPCEIEKPHRHVGCFSSSPGSGRRLPQIGFWDEIRQSGFVGWVEAKPKTQQTLL